jgi:RNA polymerase sigma-70 factor (ECF subfamily)
MPDVLETSGEAIQVRTASEQVAAEFFDRYRDRLLRMITLRTDTRIIGKVDSENILQDAFVAGVRRIDGYLERPSAPAFVWLRQLTSQILIDTHRRYLGAQKRDARLEVTLNWGDPTCGRWGDCERRCPSRCRAATQG